MKPEPLTAEDPQRELALKFGMQICEATPTLSVSDAVLEKLTYHFAKRHLILPWKEEDGAVIACVADPLNLDGIEELQFLLGKSVVGAYCPKEFLLTALQELFQGAQSASELLADLKQRNAVKDGEVEVYDLFDQKHQPPIIQLINVILSEAIEQGASDIHFEPLENDLRIRYRIDGVLQNRHSPDPKHQAQLLTRVKVMAQLDIAEHRLPQDGRIKVRMGNREIDFRVSTIPVSQGERIVLRILDKGNVVLGLDKIGIPTDLLAQLRQLLRFPEGIILVTGPTGSGKTTTLYSALSEISTEEINIMTIEDPIEYKLQGIAQIGVRPKIGLTFAAGLRHILRQDPDIVMIGEIRDRETAEIAIQSSLTGHLVFSTLHTNDAPSALTRLVDMGIESYLLTSSVVGVLAQRLVRKVCLHCKEAYSPQEAELKEIRLKALEGRRFYRGKGCHHCFGSGYKGRVGLYELMPVTQAIKQQLSKAPDASELRRCALEEGMRSLAESGARLVARGVTTTAEVLRVTRSASRRR